MKRSLILILFTLGFTNVARAEVDPEIHSLCRDVRDYLGCVKINSKISAENNVIDQKKEDINLDSKSEAEEIITSTRKYPHHLDLKSNDRSKLVKLCKSEKVTNDKKKICDDSGLFFGDYYIWDKNRYVYNSEKYSTLVDPDREYSHHLDYNYKDRNYLVKLCTNKLKLSFKKKWCDDSGLFKDNYFSWDENERRYKKN